jgi:hypothetical protein
MNILMKSGLTLALLLASSRIAQAQATITGPSSWAAGQPTTVTWTGSSSPVCASGVRVTLNINGAQIQTGSPVPISAGKATIPAITLAAGSTVVLTLTDQCISKKIDSNARSVLITGGAVAATPGTAPANAITPQVRQNIDAACQGALGAACSTSASYSATYTAITQQIGAGKLGSDTSSVLYNYLIPMVKGNTGWQQALIASAWSATRCAGPAPQSQWLPKYGTWTTYQQLYNMMAQQGCSGAAANAQQIAVVQYLSPAQMTPAYNQVWGSAAARATMMTNCPVANGAVSCARSALATYVKANGSAILQTIAAVPYQSVTGSSLDSTHAQTIATNFGRTWTGADDLPAYLQANPPIFPASTVFAGLDNQGCLINASGRKLSANESCGNYYLDANGAHAPGVYPATLGKTMVILSAANPGRGVLVSNNGSPLRVIETQTRWAIGNNIVAQGGGNIVAQGGGNIVAQGGGNIVAQGGGNIILQGCCNAAFTDASSAARTAGLLDMRGASVISNDGGSFLPTLNQVPAIARLVGDNGGGLLTDNGAALQRGTLSVTTAQAAVIKGPSTWTYGQPLMINWTPTPGAAACSSGYYVLINGTKTLGNPIALNVGKSLLPANAWPRGTVSVSLYSPCTKAPATAPYTVRIQ